MAIAGAIAVVPSRAQTYGKLTITGHRAHKRITGQDLHVWVDGDVTARCYEADDISGYALVYCEDEDEHRDWRRSGRKHLNAHAACRLQVRGTVVIAPGRALFEEQPRHS